MKEFIEPNPISWDEGSVELSRVFVELPRSTVVNVQLYALWS